MSSDHFPADEEYDKQCGEIFLTIKGDLVIHCTLCEIRYKGFQDYAAHVNDAHYNPFEVEEFASYSDDECILPIAKKNKFDLDIVKVEDDFEIESIEDDIDEDENLMLSVKEEFLDEFVQNENQNELPANNVESSFQNEFIKQQPEEPKQTIQQKYRFMVEKRGRPKKYAISLSERKHQCPYCEFSCSERSNLIGHMNRHSNNKPHKCAQCPKAFYTRTELNTHVFSHTGERPFLCTDCGQGFTTSSKLNGHKKRHTNQRDRECNMCDMKFFDLNALKKHLAVHSEERPYKCKICPDKFKTHSSLASHMNTHINAKQYRCDICPQRFNQKCNLKVHRKMKHGTSIIEEIKGIQVD